jgi:hypothetical protein
VTSQPLATLRYLLAYVFQEVNVRLKKKPQLVN